MMPQKVQLLVLQAVGDMLIEACVRTISISGDSQADDQPFTKFCPRIDRERRALNVSEKCD